MNAEDVLLLSYLLTMKNVIKLSNSKQNKLSRETRLGATSRSPEFFFLISLANPRPADTQPMPASYLLNTKVLIEAQNKYWGFWITFPAVRTVNQQLSQHLYAKCLAFSLKFIML